MKLLGIKVSYVPVSGGVGKMVPMLVGNHVDAGVTSSSHAVKHKSELNTLVIAGSSPSESLPGVPNEPGWTIRPRGASWRLPERRQPSLQNSTRLLTRRPFLLGRW